MVSINISLHFVRIQETLTYFLKRNINLSNDSASFISKASKDCFISWYLYCYTVKAINSSIINVNKKISRNQ